MLLLCLLYIYMLYIAIGTKKVSIYAGLKGISIINCDLSIINCDLISSEI